MYIGIDPGLSGAVGLLWQSGAYSEVFDTPTSLICSSSGSKRAYSFLDMSEILRHAKATADMGGDPIHVFIEKQQAMPGQGVRSMFTIGLGYGAWLGILAALRIPFTEERPAAWKKTLGLSKDKEQSRLRAQQLFPNAPLSLKKHDGRAEALLLAWYGFKEHRGERP